MPQDSSQQSAGRNLAGGFLGLNRNQWLCIVAILCAAAVGGTTSLTDLFGPGVAKKIIAASSLLGGVVNGILALLTGQSGIVKDAAAMPGVESIKVNSNASPVLARIALDENVDKVEAINKTTEKSLSDGPAQQ